DHHERGCCSGTLCRSPSGRQFPLSRPGSRSRSSSGCDPTFIQRLERKRPMSELHEGPGPTSSRNSDEPAVASPTLADALLLLLFQPSSGTIAGEGTLYYVLAGAVLTDLGFGEHIRTGTGVTGATTVIAVPGNPPADHLLLGSWEYVVDKQRGVQTVLAAMGPALRELLLDRLVERGDIRRE